MTGPRRPNSDTLLYWGGTDEALGGLLGAVGDKRPLSAMREIAARIREARAAAGFSQEEAAASASIGYKRYQELERGRLNPTVRTPVRVASGLGVELWDLVRPKPRRRK